MKNNILLLIALTIVSSQGFSQTDEVYKTIAKETCECIGKKNYDYTKADRADVEMSLGLCMLESAQKNNLPIDIADTGSMTTLGEKVGVLMVGVCPDVFKVFIDKKEPEVEEDETEYFTASGTIKSVEEKDFLYVNLKDEAGKEYRFIWLYYFQGSDDFKADPKKLIGKKVEITYILLEALHPKSKTYNSLNIISGLQVK